MIKALMAMNLMNLRKKYLNFPLILKHYNSSHIYKMADSAISVSETNLSKKIKNLNSHLKK